MFKDFQKLKLITTRFTACPGEFSLADRRIYSFLAYRARLNKTCSEREIAKYAFVDARTAKRRLNTLAKHGLVAIAKNRWLAKEPGEGCEDWFPKNKQAKTVKHWFDSYCYSALLLPKRGATIKAGERKKFTVLHSHVYSMLISLSKKSKGVVSNCDTGKLVRLLNGTDPKSIRSAIGVLKTLGLVKTWKHKGHQAIHALPIEARHSRLFQAVNNNANEPQTEADQVSQEVFAFKHAKHESMFQECTSNGIPPDLACKIVKSAAMLALEVDSFSGYMSVASREHDLNRLKGRVHVAHPGYLLLHKLKEAAGIMDEEHEAMLAQESRPANNSRSNQYESKSEQASAEVSGEVTAGYRFKIAGELKRTREFLKSKFGRLPSSPEIHDAIESRHLKRWLHCGKIHPLFIVLCPEIRNSMSTKNLTEHFGTAVSSQLRSFSGAKEIYESVFSSDVENDREQVEKLETTSQHEAKTPSVEFDEFVLGLSTDDSVNAETSVEEELVVANGWEIQHDMCTHE